MKKSRLVFILIIITLLTGAVKSQTMTYDFSSGYEGWAGDFADYPINDSLFYELEFTRTNLPWPLDRNQYALLISGNNHSDDLFMFIKRKISGLSPNTVYQLSIDVNIASKYPTNAVGVGGAPGEGVTLKAGASIVEPSKNVQNGFYRINIDKGDQTIPGIDMDTIGNVGVSDSTTVYTIINRNNDTHLFTITTDSIGELWICIGTDSGFEATTTLYINKITLKFQSTTGIDDKKSNNTEFILYQNYPNPFNPVTSISYSVPIQSNVVIKIFEALGREVSTLVNQEKSIGNHIVEFDAANLTSGIYFCTFQAGGYRQTRKLILLK